MAYLRIGEVARAAGISTSALRYYEKIGLVAAPIRVSKRRQYDPQVVGRVRIILLAREAGFSVRETRTFFEGFPLATTSTRRWREMAERKASELDHLIARIERMKVILRASFHCACREMTDCERLVAAKNRDSTATAETRSAALADPPQRLRPRK
jgi:MerR family redox-sensitive transcriptional activator SoxR